jgi:elongation factor P--(R)-beta-lysine ligase
VLRARAAMEAAVRSHFTAAGFLEVTTPVALPHPNLDPHIRPVPVFLHDFSGRESALWLHTSPELAMKKLVARGSGSIFQIARVFRDGEVSPRHRCEFSMLEWYRTGADWRAVRDDATAVIAAAARTVTGGSTVRFAGRSYDLAGGWEEMTVQEALRRETGAPSLSRGDLAAALLARGTPLQGDEPRDELFFRLYLEAEPHFGVTRPLVVRDFPAFLGTMARPSPDDSEVLERFELYAGGLELANGYSELTDATEQARRMKETRQALEAEGAPGLTVDDDFLAALATLPPCAGVSVGLDRLLMLLLGEQDISAVLPL